MENKSSIEQILDGKDNTLVYKTRPSIALSILLIVSGALFIALNNKLSDSPGSIIPPLFTVIGLGLLGWGIVSIFIRKTKYKLIQNKKEIFFYDIFFDIKERERLINVMKERNIPELKNLKTSGIDSLKLRVAATSDGGFCLSQVLNYVPYEYINMNEVCQHTPEEAKVILEIRKNRE
ncbi:MAG: hypothetical protein LBG96_03960 [Tannerella sp.]|jgi:hypothetical protein|nr:hypothetical protein [Tannerella sp.]